MLSVGLGIHWSSLAHLGQLGSFALLPRLSKHWYIELVDGWISLYLSSKHRCERWLGGLRYRKHSRKGRHIGGSVPESLALGALCGGLDLEVWLEPIDRVEVVITVLQDMRMVMTMVHRILSLYYSYVHYFGDARDNGLCQELLYSTVFIFVNSPRRIDNVEPVRRITVLMWLVGPRQAIAVCEYPT